MCVHLVSYESRSRGHGAENTLHVVSVDETNTSFMPDVDTWGNRRETDRLIKKNMGGKEKKDKKTKR